MNNLVCGIVAHVDAGKTTLSEALLYATGVRRQLGRVDHQDAFLDNHHLERQRGITIFSKIAQLPGKMRTITLVDTPGHVDFSAEAERTMPILDCALLVINGSDGVQAHTLTLWELLERYQVPTFLFVNKMDLPGLGKEKLLGQLQQKLSEHIVDFTMEPELLAEQAAMCDEALLEQYLETGVVTDGNLQGLVGSRKLFPCCFGSALKLEGVEDCLRLLERYGPSQVYPQEYAARVYKISRDAQGNRLTWLKVTGGSLKVRSTISYTGRDGKLYTEKLVSVRHYSGAQFTPMETAPAGTVCAVQGLSATYAGQGLGTEADSSDPILEPVMAYRVQLPGEFDPLVVLPKLRLLEEEDPMLRILWDERSKQIHVQLMGRVQLEILQSLIQSRFGIPVTFDTGRISYKETITNTVEGVGHFEPLRHYAEVHLLLEPGEPGSGIVIDTQCPLDVLEVSYQKLILTHIAEKTHLGVRTGSPITDMKITLMSGRAHLKHTEGGDFRQATYRAIRQGLMQADSQILEPWYDFTLTVPTAQIGRAITDIRAMSGAFQPPEQIGEHSTLKGQVPVAEVGDYAAQVASYTRGLGVFQTRLRGYLPCHNAEAVIAGADYDPVADLENTPDSVFCAHGAGFNVRWDQVPEYMHLSSVLEKPEQPQIVTRNLRLDDKELEQIMEREFGPAKRRQYTAPKATPATDRHPIQPPRPKTMIVDGYNVLFANTELEEMSKIDLGSARQRLLDKLGNFAAYRNIRTVVVFDGYKAKGNPGEKSRWENLQIVYTRQGQTADSYIEAMAVEIGRNDSVQVVSSDALIQLTSFRSGLLRQSARELWEEMDRCEEQIRQFLEEFRQKENRKFKEK